MQCILCTASLSQAPQHHPQSTPHAADEMLRSVLGLERLLGRIVRGHAWRLRKAALCVDVISRRKTIGKPQENHGKTMGKL